MLRSACSLAVVAGLALPAAADIPPPPPYKGFKRVPYEFVLKLDTELPGYNFYPFQRLGLGGQETIGDELKFKTDAGTVVAGSSSPSVRTGVVAVPARVMDEIGWKETLARLLSRQHKDVLPAGVVVFETRGTSLDLKDSDPRTKVQSVVTVSRDDTAGVKFTARDTPAPAGQDVGPEVSAWPPPGQVVAGVAAGLAVVALGVWYARRK